MPVLEQRFKVRSLELYKLYKMRVASGKRVIDGIENWFQTETASELLNNGANVTVWGKRDYDADLIVDGNGVELRCQQNYGSNMLTKAITIDHQRAEYYLFLHVAVIDITTRALQVPNPIYHQIKKPPYYMRARAFEVRLKRCLLLPFLIHTYELR